MARMFATHFGNGDKILQETCSLPATMFTPMPTLSAIRALNRPECLRQISESEEKDGTESARCSAAFLA